MSVTYDPKKPARGRITGELDARAIEIGVLVVCLVTQAILELPTVVLFQVF
ncbi:hypothetical protein [Streptomyces sp. NPDC001843]|uniref:hypothetical protein n=1 Tax=Streptomyces sp. NPDC001843 TaxID=3364617 RepID=UPI0036C8D361